MIKKIDDRREDKGKIFIRKDDRRVVREER